MTILNITFCTLLLTIFSCGNKLQTNKRALIINSENTDLNEIILVPADLNIISCLTINQETEYFDTEVQLTEQLALELIDKPDFDSKKNSAVDFLLVDTVVNKKINGVIELKCQNKTGKYIDNPVDRDDVQIFQYIGQIESLNQYLVRCTYWEGLDYRFIDKTSGEESAVFNEYPYISPDKKNIICIYTNPYERTADLELYSVSDNKITKIIDVSFKNWMPTVNPGEMFWSSDGYLYLTVNHSNSFWTADGYLNDKCQYIRIKIL